MKLKHSQNVKIAVNYEFKAFFLEYIFERKKEKRICRFKLIKVLNLSKYKYYLIYYYISRINLNSYWYLIVLIILTILIILIILIVLIILIILSKCFLHYALYNFSSDFLNHLIFYLLQNILI